MLTSSSVLVHYSPTLELTLACDASQYGLGAVLSHRFPNGEEKPMHMPPARYPNQSRITHS